MESTPEDIGFAIDDLVSTALALGIRYGRALAVNGSPSRTRLLCVEYVIAMKQAEHVLCLLVGADPTRTRTGDPVAKEIGL